MLPRNAFVDTIGGDLYLDKTTENDCGTYLCTVKSLVGMEECELILSFTSPLTMNYGHGTTAAAVVIVVVDIVITIITVICYCHRKKNGEEFSNEILEVELLPHKWLSTKSDKVVSWPQDGRRAQV